MKSAKEMFEESGYKHTDLLKYPSANFVNKEYETSISIFDNEKGRRINIQALGNTYQDSGMIDDRDLKAIVQYCEELGWLDEYAKLRRENWGLKTTIKNLREKVGKRYEQL